MTFYSIDLTKRDFSTAREDVCKTVPNFNSINLTEPEILSSLNQIKPKKAPGPDGLSGKILKFCSHQLKGVLTNLFQILLHTSTVPNTWKQSNIVPVPKKPGATELNDFRPIALTSIM